MIVVNTLLESLTASCTIEMLNDPHDLRILTVPLQNHEGELLMRLIARAKVADGESVEGSNLPGWT
jgi:hypothetical protein